MTPVYLTLALALAVAAAVAIAGLIGTWRLALHLARRRRLSRRGLALASAGALATAAGLGCYLWGALVEVDRLSVTRLALATPSLPAGTRLRIVQLSDLHVEARTRALAALPDRVNALEPDVILFTGDALNRRAGLPIFRETIGRLRARHGLFAVRGNFDLGQLAAGLLDGTGVVELDGAPVVVPAQGGGATGGATGGAAGGAAGEAAGGAAGGATGAALVLCGAPVNDGPAVARCLAEARARGLAGARVVAFHTPDLIEDLAPLGPELYLAGHTHGGQVRLPGFGAVITMSRFGKRYEMGRYRVGETTLFVSRGVGTETAPAPRVRFLCPPEIVVIDLIGTGVGPG